MSWTVVVAIAALLLMAGVSIIGYLHQRRRLAAIVRRIVANERDGVSAVFAVGRFVFSNVLRTHDPVFLLSALRPIGASPLAVLRRGGCCSGIHRLFIACLETIGIQAAQVTLYHPSGAALHCTTQVRAEGQVFLVDVDYGVVFKHPAHGALGVAQLREGVQPVIQVFANGLTAPTTLSRGGRTPGYRGGYHIFNFKETRTANWTKSWIRRKAHWLLNMATNGRINYMLLPPLLEWPQIILALLSTFAALLILMGRVAFLIWR